MSYSIVPLSKSFNVSVPGTFSLKFLFIPTLHIVTIKNKPWYQTKTLRLVNKFVKKCRKNKHVLRHLLLVTENMLSRGIRLG